MVLNCPSVQKMDLPDSVIASAKKEADPENEDDFVLEEINLDEVEPEDMTGDIVEDITKVISVGDLTPEKIREEMEESE